MALLGSEDFNRRDISLYGDKVVEVLPEYFGEDYPKLIELLEAYYEFMEDNGNPGNTIHNMYDLKDIESVSISLLDLLLKETGGGARSESFPEPREAAKNIPKLFRVKGTLYSAEWFFRTFYGEDAEIVYPKDNIFIVGESNIGAESIKFIQDGALYQILSVLVKTSLPISKWKDQYKTFVHPAGYYLGGEILSVGLVDLRTDLECMPTAIPATETGPVLVTPIAVTITTESSITGIL